MENLKIDKETIKEIYPTSVAEGVINEHDNDSFLKFAFAFSIFIGWLFFIGTIISTLYHLFEYGSKYSYFTDYSWITLSIFISGFTGFVFWVAFGKIIQKLIKKS